MPRPPPSGPVARRFSRTHAKRARPATWLRAAAAALATIGLALGSPALAADEWPARPIRLVVGVPAGSVADLDARFLAEGLEKELPANVVVDNRPGADGIIAVGQVTGAPADGYTLLFGLGSQVAINPATYASLPYDAKRDLAPVSLIAHQALLVVVHPSLPVATMKELVDYTRAHPASVNYAAGTSTFFLAAEALKQHSGADMQHIPFNGAGPALAALLAGTVQVAMIPANNAPGPAQAGRMRVLATSGVSRLAAFPDVPTFAELGLPDDVPVWTALFAPAGTPSAIIDRLHAAVVRFHASPAVRARVAANAETLVAGTPEELAATVARDAARMEALVRRLRLAPR
jgi:tripartite-type tricarboxylate transporter receptor subunit TctC